MLGELLYQLLISPLELFLEVIYGIARNLFGNPGLSIFLMSLAMNLLLLPLYRQADAIQAKEQDDEKKLEPVVKHIKKTFRGDERYMMLQTYYNQNHYKPYYSLRGLLPLALEIPFFIAAYHFLSNLWELHGGTLGPIRNLGAPDKMIEIGALTINVLPVLMTLINIASSAVYTKGYALKDKVKLYGMALLFLVLLYNSPSGLVFYWTLNNLFSLIKNLLCRLRNSRKIVQGFILAAGAVLLLYTVFYYRGSVRHKSLLIGLALFMGFSPFFNLLKKKIFPVIHVQEKTSYRMFLLGGIFLSVLTGILIPSGVVSSSPEEFVQLPDFYSPISHIVYAALCAVGVFIIWFGVFYFLLGKKQKRIFEIAVFVVSGMAIVDYMFFGTGLGELSSSLAYESNNVWSSLISMAEKTGNIFVLLILIVFFTVLFVRKEKIARAVYYVLIAAIVCMSIPNISQIQHATVPMKQMAEKMRNKEKAHFTLSRNGKNVVVLMLDRAIGCYIPYLFQENPKLVKQFAGFTYYPNTLSFGGFTNFAAPALFGGYEYTPEELNKRSKELLADKHNEALKVMPVVFEKAGYDVTVCDPPYAGYTWIPDLSIYDEYPNIHTYNTEQGQFTGATEEEKQMTRLWKRNFFCYSIMKISPVIIQPYLYQRGSYFMNAKPESDAVQTIDDLSHAKGTKKTFINCYSVLSSLSEMANISDSGNNFLMMQNGITHEPCLLEEPDYIPSEFIDNEAYDTKYQKRFLYNGRQMEVSTPDHMMHYQTNMAALIKLGEWMDYLRENGVYDNTRIIIVADHGRYLNQFKDMLFGDNNDEDVMHCNPLLLVKDFNGDSLVTDDSFMTNADVPTLAMKNLIENPVNPYTGKPINSNAKNNKEQLVIFSFDIETTVNNGTTFLPARWFSVHDNIFDLRNWKRLGEW